MFLGETLAVMSMRDIRYYIKKWNKKIIAGSWGTGNMRNTASVNVLSFFVLGMSVCLLYSSEFFAFRRNRVFDGYTCPESKRVFSMDKVYSDMQCAFYCKGSSLCVDIFYHPQDKRCDGCRDFEDSELEIADGFLYYTRRGKYSWHIVLVQF
jgi:hypothetical protein